MDRDEERPRWSEGEEEEPREWEIEPEEEKEDRNSILGGTAPVARMVFLAIVLFVVVSGLVALVRTLGRHFGR